MRNLILRAWGMPFCKPQASTLGNNEPFVVMLGDDERYAGQATTKQLVVYERDLQ